MELILNYFGQNKNIPFVKTYVREESKELLNEALNKAGLQGDGDFTKKCHVFLAEKLDCHSALLTHSCTAALEMAALLLDLKEGDEVIMPSYTFTSTATAVVLRGAIPVFIDIRPDTLNIDESLIEGAITSKTKAVFPVHYAGVSAEMDTINQIAKKHNLFVVEDAAQGVGAFYKKKPLGTLGELGAFSFHGTKNIISGEGGALIINNSSFSERAEIIREKGTNRSQFLRGEVDKYTWQDIGSSYLPNELTAAFLYSQLLEMDEINQMRVNVWNQYHAGLENLEVHGYIARPFVPLDCQHNGHIYYLIVQNRDVRDGLLKYMRDHFVQCTSHYVPLHSSPAGVKYGRFEGNMSITNLVASKIIRLPIWPHLDNKSIEIIINLIYSFFEK